MRTGDPFDRPLSSLGRDLHVEHRKKALRGVAREPGSPALTGYHRDHDRAVHQQAELMRKFLRLGRPGLGGERLDALEDRALVRDRDRSKAVFRLVVFANGVDERVTIETV